MINVNGTDDIFYRYKMEKVSVTHRGNGNGLVTIINNLDSISKKINTPSEILYKFISNDLGTNYNEKKKSITGQHSQAKIQDIIYGYINNYVICKKCGIPELNYKINKSEITATCSACGNLYKLIESNNKGYDLILKYLQKNKIWINTKGNMVEQNKTSFLPIPSFNSEEFGKYVDSVQDLKQNCLETSETLKTSETSETSDNFNPFS